MHTSTTPSGNSYHHNSDFSGDIHISDNNLGHIGIPAVDIQYIAAAIQAAGYHGSVEIQPEDAITALRQQLDTARLRLAAVVMAICPGPHRPTQHRDHQPPWCAACGRTSTGEQIKQTRPGDPTGHTPRDSAIINPDGLTGCTASGMCPRLVRTGIKYCCSPCGDGWEAEPRHEAVHTESCDTRDLERRPGATR